MSQPAYRKKLIEVAMPLEAINIASGREKSIRHGHPSTLHLWWARRPLAACRAVIFGQLVDDPCAWPARFPTDEACAAERERLHQVIREMVEWPGSSAADQAKFEQALDAARFEIARSAAWGRGEEPPTLRGEVLAYLAQHAPPVYDPFCGGGSIPLEAQRLGLRAYGSDLNPVAVLISKALVEIPPKFAGRPPVRPGGQDDGLRRWRGAQGLAEDVRHYGAWMREEARRRIGHLYPDATLSDGRKATVIAWLWARTVRSPDPAAKGAMVPLASSFVLSSKAGREAIVKVVRDAAAPDGWRFEVKQGGVTAEELRAAKAGTIGRSEGGVCSLSGVPMPFSYVRAEGRAGRMSRRLMAIVAEGGRGRVYVSPIPTHETLAEKAEPSWKPDSILPNNTRDFKTPLYGLSSYGDLFTDRQLVALTTFADLVGEARARVLADAQAAFRETDATPLVDGGAGPTAYADAVATYLAFAISKASTRNCSLAIWEPGMGRLAGAMGRQALPMQWSFAETNPLAGAGGDIEGAAISVAENLDNLGARKAGSVLQLSAQNLSSLDRRYVFSTDPPYYDNIGYADLSDFFYVWLRRSINTIWPDLFRRVVTPKTEELVATPYRHGGREAAEQHFMMGMSGAIRSMRSRCSDDFPLCMFYAFKQSDSLESGITSIGWATFLQAIVDAGLVLDGTWPVRTEATNALKAKVNALASSVVLVCRSRPDGAPSTTRRDFLAELRRELPEAIARMKAAGLHPVDLPQAALGPGMAVFSKYALVREADDAPMSVSRAIALINQVRSELDHADAAELDAPTRFALDWFASFGWMEKGAGEAIKLAQSYNLSERELAQGGVLVTARGQARLARREEMGADAAARPGAPVWMIAQALNQALNAGGGVAAAGALLARAEGRAGEARWLTSHLFRLAEDRRMSEEALGWGALADSWDAIEAAASMTDPPPASPEQPALL